MRRMAGWIVLGGVVVAGCVGCAPSAKPLIGPGALRAPALAEGEDAGASVGEAGDAIADEAARVEDGAGAGEYEAIEPESFDVFRASSFASGDGHRLVTMRASGDCAGRGGGATMTLRFLSIEEMMRADGVIERTTRLMRHAREDNPLIMRVEYGGGGDREGWSMVSGGFVEELRALRTHREVFVPSGGGEDGNGRGEMRLLGTTNHERGNTLWFVADGDDGGADGLVIDPALSEAKAEWRTAGVIEGDEPTGEVRGTARLRSWIAGESSGEDLPPGLVVMTELRIELGGAVLERDVARVYAKRDGCVMMRFERSVERTRVMGFGGGMRCEFGVVGVDVVGR